MTKTCWLCAAVAWIAAGALPCQAQSLWQRRDAMKTNLFADTQARKIGDLLTVIVREDTDVDNKDQRALDKSTEAGGTFDFSGQTDARSASAALQSKSASDRKFDGSSRYTVERGLSDRITVAVLDVQPNGNLVIGGKRRRVVTGEVRTLVISGIVRELDISADNTVASQYIANFEVGYEGAGPESEFSNQGWLGRVGNAIWPF